jgi:hypothetical protein
MRTLLLFSVILILSSCAGEDCRNQNPVLNEQHSDSREYKFALAQEVNRIDRSVLHFSVDHYDRAQDLLYVEVWGPNLCATMPVKVKKWDKLLEVKRENPEFKNANLLGFKFHVKTNRDGIYFEYRDLERMEKYVIDVLEIDSVSIIHDTTEIKTDKNDKQRNGR